MEGESSFAVADVSMRSRAVPPTEVVETLTAADGCVWERVWLSVGHGLMQLMWRKR